MRNCSVKKRDRDIQENGLFLEQRNKKILDEVRKHSLKQNLVEIYKELDSDLVKGAFAGEKFKELFFTNCKNEELKEYIRGILR